jgi:anti-anti-sigma factor
MAPDDPEELEIQEHHRGDAVVLTLRGELDLGSVEALQGRLDELRESGSPVVLDLDELGFIDSIGLRCVLQAAEAARAEHWSFGVTAGGGPVRDLFAAAGVLDRLPIVERP